MKNGLYGVKNIFNHRSILLMILFVILLSMQSFKSYAGSNKDILNLITACEQNDIKAFRKLWQKKSVRINAAAENNLALIRAAENNNIEMFNKLWEIKAVRDNAATGYNAAFVSACAHNNMEMFNKLWEMEDVRDNSNSLLNAALISSCKHNNSYMFDKLWEIDHVRDNLTNAFQFAIYDNNVEAIDALLSNKDVCAAIQDKRELLDYAKQNNKPIMLEKLAKVIK